MTKKKNSPKRKRPSLFKKHRKIIIIFFVVFGVLLISGGGILVAQGLANKAVEDEITTCVSEVKKDPLGFASKCYEDNGREVPADIKEADKNRVDRILAQESYDLCMANAEYSKLTLWDINDTEILNGKFEGSHHSGFIDREYSQIVDDCRVRHKLTGDYEPNFKTYYAKILVGWKEPKNYARPNENTPIIDRYNSDGKIEAYSNIPSDQEIPDSIGTVGGIIAKRFKDNHLDWWY